MEEFTGEVFQKQLALMMEEHLEFARRERIVSETEERANDIAVRFLRTNYYDKTDEEQVAVINELLRQYDDVLEHTVMSVSKLN